MTALLRETYWRRVAVYTGSSGLLQWGQPCWNSDDWFPTGSLVLRFTSLKLEKPWRLSGQGPASSLTTRAKKKSFRVLRTLHDDCMQIAPSLRQQSSMGNVIVFALLLTALEAGWAGLSQAVEVPLTAIRWCSYRSSLKYLSPISLLSLWDL